MGASVAETIFVSLLFCSWFGLVANGERRRGYFACSTRNEAGILCNLPRISDNTIISILGAFHNGDSYSKFALSGNMVPIAGAVRFHFSRICTNHLRLQVF